jgi:hypothetical protein
MIGFIMVHPLVTWTGNGGCFCSSDIKFNSLCSSCS